ncbi:AAA family ATPase [Myxococcota bacterium]|nr:AAA family ATPase [Myxococcota bacterium]
MSDASEPKPTSPSEPTRCARCGFENPAIMRFCGGCGQPLARGSVPVPPASTDPYAALPGAAEIDGAARAGDMSGEGDRRQITVLFCDLVGSTKLSEELDPEELRELVRKYQLASEEVVSRYEGHIAQYLGDGILVYFGFPVAHEDDPWRGVSAGLGILDAMRTLNDHLPPKGPKLSVRVGIHTGFGVAGDVGGKLRREQLVIGRAPNVAARLQGLADPDSVVVSDDTRRLVEGFFEFHGLGAREIKGISEPVGVHLVLAAKDVRGRFEVTRSRGLSPFLGREKDLELLRARFEDARAGHGQAVLITAEPGLGKSRLVHELEQLTKGVARTIVAQAAPHSQNDPFVPIIELVRDLVGIERREATDAKLAKLSKRLEERGITAPEALPLVATFVGLPAPATTALVGMSPHKLRETTLRFVVQLLVAEASTGPLVVEFEDLHWADPSSLDVTRRLIEACGSAPVLVLLTARPQFQWPFPDAPNLARIVLGPLGADEVTNIVLALTGNKPLPREVLRLVVDKTDGVPLFVEELTKLILESGLVTERDGRWELARPLDAPAIPATLRDSLTARLDHLGPAKETAQLASAIGRRFAYELLAGISPRDERLLRKQVEAILAADLSLRDPVEVAAESYMFKHALVQEVAHESMLKSRRREVHERIARRLLAEWPELADERPELLAGHFEEAGLLEDAVFHLHKAGQRAMVRGSHAEALAEFSRALGLLEHLPESARHRRELEIRISMSGSLIATRGYCAPDLEQSSIRARRLCALLDDPPELFPVLYTLWVINLASSRRAATEDYAKQLLELVQRSPSPMLELSAWFANGNTYFYEGRLDDAERAYAEVAKRYSPDQHATLAAIYGDDHGLYAQTYVAYIQAHRGLLDQARETEKRYLALAEGFRDPLAIALALASAMTLRRDLREPDEALRFADRLVALSAEQGFPFWISVAQCVRGWVNAQYGEHEEGLKQLEQGLAFFELIGQKLPLTYYLALHTEALLAAKRFDKGLEVVERALTLAASNVDSFYTHDLLRLKGELLAAKAPGHPEAAPCFERALELARASGAAYFELRAATSLARFAKGTADQARAAGILGAAITKLREGFDSADYLEARALLAELGKSGA